MRAINVPFERVHMASSMFLPPGETEWLYRQIDYPSQYRGLICAEGCCDLLYSMRGTLRIASEAFPGSVEVKFTIAGKYMFGSRYLTVTVLGKEYEDVYDLFGYICRYVLGIKQQMVDRKTYGLADKSVWIGEV